MRRGSRSDGEMLLGLAVVAVLLTAGVLWQAVKTSVWLNAIGLHVTYWQAVALEMGSLALVIGVAITLAWLSSRR